MYIKRNVLHLYQQIETITFKHTNDMENYKREDLRIEFESRNLNYSKIDSESIMFLSQLLHKELTGFNNKGFTMELKGLRVMDNKFNENGSLIKCHFMVSGIIGSGKNKIIHFERREAISFNTENKKGFGFIGFAGWADDKNVQPFLRAFKKWLITLSE